MLLWSLWSRDLPASVSQVLGLKTAQLSKQLLKAKTRSCYLAWQLRGVCVGGRVVQTSRFTEAEISSLLEEELCTSRQFNRSQHKLAGHLDIRFLEEFGNFPQDSAKGGQTLVSPQMAWAIIQDLEEPLHYLALSPSLVGSVDMSWNSDLTCSSPGMAGLRASSLTVYSLIYWLWSWGCRVPQLAESE